MCVVASRWTCRMSMQPFDDLNVYARGSITESGVCHDGQRELIAEEMMIMTFPLRQQRKQKNLMKCKFLDNTLGRPLLYQILTSFPVSVIVDIKPRRCPGRSVCTNYNTCSYSGTASIRCGTRT
jgi:hypothetical protein